MLVLTRVSDPFWLLLFFADKIFNNIIYNNISELPVKKKKKKKKKKQHMTVIDKYPYK